jgi:hypothetical protein
MPMADGTNARIAVQPSGHRLTAVFLAVGTRSGIVAVNSERYSSPPLDHNDPSSA